MTKTSEARRIANRARRVRKKVDGHHAKFQEFHVPNCAPILQRIAGESSGLHARGIGDDDLSHARGDPRHRRRWRRHDTGARQRLQRHCVQRSERCNAGGNKLKRRTDEIGEGKAARLAAETVLSEAIRFGIPETRVRAYWKQGLSVEEGFRLDIEEQHLTPGSVI